MVFSVPVLNDGPVWIFKIFLLHNKFRAKYWRENINNSLSEVNFNIIKLVLSLFLVAHHKTVSWKNVYSAYPETTVCVHIRKKCVKESERLLFSSPAETRNRDVGIDKQWFQSRQTNIAPIVFDCHMFELC